MTRRTSLITDPPDGELPRLTPEAEQRRDARAAALRERGSADSWEDRALNERCLKNPANGPPILPLPIEILLGQMFLFQIVQTPEYVAILSEVTQNSASFHWTGARIFREAFVSGSATRGGAGKAERPVETTNLHESLSIAGFPAGNMRVVEGFTRTDADSIDYQFRSMTQQRGRSRGRRQSEHKDERTNLRICVPRGKLRIDEYPEGRTRSGESPIVQ